MKLSSKLSKALNEQIGMEFAAAHSYLSMSAYFEQNSWDGFASWMATQSDEERAHAMKFYQYVLDRGGDVKLPAIPAPQSAYKSVLDVFENSLKQEQSVSKSIYALYKLALADDDFATVSFLKWFVDEQVEEEKTVSDIIEKIKRAASNSESLMQLDRYAGERKADAAGS